MQDAVGLWGINGSPFPSLLFASTFPLGRGGSLAAEGAAMGRRQALTGEANRRCRARGTD
jgi:hypothetical protein